jgi:hypothetical protein
MAMNAHKPWRLEDMKFRDHDGKRRGVIGPVVVEESGGQYSVTVASHHLKFTRHNLEQKSVDAALSTAFNIGRG